jgi:acyl carrier protein
METIATETDVQAWLASRVVTYGKKVPGSFSVDTDFAEIGLDSVYALTLCGDIEDEYGIEVDPEIMWDYSTIRALADHLTELGAR